MRHFVTAAGMMMAVAVMSFGQFHLPGTGGKSDPAPKTKAPAAAPAPVAAVTEAPAFEYYVLSLSWTPGKRGPFLVQGLLPEKRESCKSDRKLSRGVMNLALPLMQSQNAVQAEWDKHGSCTELSPADYFNGMRYARSQVQIPVQMTSLEDTATESPLQIEAQFAGANPAFPPESFRVACEGGRFTEVRVCFDRQFKPRECTASAGECGAAELSIRPR